MLSPARTRLGLPGLLAMIALSGLWLSACGDDTAEREAAIDSTLERAFTEFGGPSDCEEIYTEDSLRQQQLLSDDDDPVEACEETLAEQDSRDEAESIETEGLELGEGEARVTVTPDGGNLDATRVRLRLVEAAPEGGDGGIAYKVDVIEDVEILERDRVTANQVNQSGLGDFSKVIDASCVRQYLNKKVSDEQIENGIVDPEDRSYIFDTVRVCVGSGSDFLTLFRVVYFQFIDAFEEGGLDDPKGIAACVAGFMVPDLTDITVRDELTIEDVATDSEVKERLNEAAEKAASTTIQSCIGAPAPKGLPSPEGGIPKGG